MGGTPATIGRAFADVVRYDFVILARTRHWAWPRMRNPDLLSLSHHDAAAYVAIGVNISLYSVDIHAWSKLQFLFAIVARALNFSAFLGLILRMYVIIPRPVSRCMPRYLTRPHSNLATLQP